MNIINETKVIIMDDHPLYLMGLKKIINDSPIFHVLECCKTTSELLFSLNNVTADIAIIDLSRPEGEGDICDVVEQLHERHPEMAMVALGENRHHQLLSMALRPRIKAYFCKSLTPEHILSGLLRINQLQTWETFQPQSQTATKKVKASLSAREKIIIEYLHSGITVSEVAKRVQRSVKTVSAQKRAAMRKLGITQERDIFQLKLNKI